MQSSLFNKFTPTLAIKKQVNLYVVNTFFALSAASYYVGTYSLPKDLHWAKYITKLYTLQEDTQFINQETGFPGNLYAFAHYHPTMRTGDISALRVSTRSFQPLQKTSKQIGGETSIVPNTSLSDTPFSMGESFSLEQMPGQTNSFVGSELPRLSPQPPSPHSPPLMPESSIVQNLQTQSISAAEDSNLGNLLHHLVTISSNPPLSEGKARNDMMDKTNAFTDELFTSNRIQGSSLEVESFGLPLRPSSLKTPPLVPENPVAPNIQTQSNSPVADSNLENRLSNVSTPVNSAQSNERPISIQTATVLVENALANVITVSSPLPQESLLSWRTYFQQAGVDPNSVDRLLRWWIRTLAPDLETRTGPAMTSEEIRFRHALIDTLLSEEFRSKINDSWLFTHDVRTKASRRNFFEKYIERAFGGQNVHTLDGKEYSRAIKCPWKLRIGVYREDDLVWDDH